MLKVLWFKLVKTWGLTLVAEDIKDLAGETAYAKAIDLLLTRRASCDNKLYWAEKTPGISLRFLSCDAYFLTRGLFTFFAMGVMWLYR